VDRYVDQIAFDMFSRVVRFRTDIWTDEVAADNTVDNAQDASNNDAPDAANDNAAHHKTPDDTGNPADNDARKPAGANDSNFNSVSDLPNG